MLNCVVDGRARNIEVGGACNLGNLISSINREMAEAGKVVSTLRINGEEFFGDENELVLRGDMGPTRIEITTDTPSNLAMQTLASGQEYIEDMRDFLLKTVDMFRTGQEQKAKEYFLESVEGLQWLVKMVGYISQILRIDFKSMLYDGASLSKSVDELNQIFLDIISAQEHADSVLIADLLEYELAPQMERWKRIFSSLQERQQQAA